MNKHTDKKILVEARDWFMKMNTKSVTLQSHAEFKAWLAENSIHGQKYNLVKAIWQGSEVLKEHPLTIQEIWRSREAEMADNRHAWFTRWLAGFKIFRPVWKPAAVFAAMLVIIVAIWFPKADKADNDSKTIYYTQTGEQKSVYQPDGTLVHLDAETKITENFSEKKRNIELEKGRASFDVFHDKSRPFVVTAGSVVVTALGTKFNVSIKKTGKVIVSVAEGRVQIDDNNTMPVETKKPSTNLKKKTDQAKKVISAEIDAPYQTQQKILVPGQQLVVESKQISSKVISVNIDNANAWQAGRLHFEKAPLNDVIDDMNRYLENKIVIMDKHLYDIPITMNFNIKHRKDFVVALKGAIAIDTTTSSDGSILLTVQN